MPRKTPLTDEERKAKTRRQMAQQKERMQADPAYAARRKAMQKAALEARMADPEYAERQRAKVAARTKRRYDALMSLPADSPEREAYRARRRKTQKAYRDQRRARIRDICRASRSRCRARDPQAYDAHQKAVTRRYREVHGAQIKERKQARRKGSFSKAQTPRFNATVVGYRAYQMADKHVPRTLPSHARGDVMGDIVLACLESRITVDEIPANVQRFVSAYWKGRDLFGTLSLDAPIGEEGTTFLDRLVAPETEDHPYA